MSVPSTWTTAFPGYEKFATKPTGNLAVGNIGGAPATAYRYGDSEATGGFLVTTGDGMYHMSHPTGGFMTVMPTPVGEIGVHVTNVNMPKVGALLYAPPGTIKTSEDISNYMKPMSSLVPDVSEAMKRATAGMPWPAPVPVPAAGIPEVVPVLNAAPTGFVPNIPTGIVPTGDPMAGRTPMGTLPPMAPMGCLCTCSDCKKECGEDDAECVVHSGPAGFPEPIGSTEEPPRRSRRAVRRAPSGRFENPTRGIEEQFERMGGTGAVPTEHKDRMSGYGF